MTIFFFAWLPGLRVGNLEALYTAFEDAGAAPRQFEYARVDGGGRRLLVGWDDDLAIQLWPAQFPVRLYGNGVCHVIRGNGPLEGEPTVAHVAIPQFRNAKHATDQFQRVGVLVQACTPHNYRDFALLGFMFGYQVFVPFDFDPAGLEQFVTGLSQHPRIDLGAMTFDQSPDSDLVHRIVTDRSRPWLLENLRQ